MELGNQNYSTAAGMPANTNASTFDAILASVRDGISTYQAARAEARAYEAGKINPELGPRSSMMPLLILAAVAVGALMLFDGGKK